MDYFQLSVKEKTRMFMFTASELKRKKNKKGNNNNSGSDYNDTQNGCNGYISIIQDFYDCISLAQYQMANVSSDKIAKKITEEGKTVTGHF